MQMGPTSKDLLELEQQKSSDLETSFLICSKDQSPYSKIHSSRNDGQKLLTTPIPASQVLGKVKDFLGIMAEANKRLEQGENSSSDYDIEVLTGNEKEYVEMDLVLGVADLHTPEAVAAAESAVSGSRSSIPQSAISGSDSEDSDSENNDVDDPCSAKEIQRTDLESGDSVGGEKPKKRPKVTDFN